MLLLFLQKELLWHVYTQPQQSIIIIAIEVFIVVIIFVIIIISTHHHFLFMVNTLEFLMSSIVYHYCSE